MDQSREVRRGGGSRFSAAKRQMMKQSDLVEGMDSRGGDVVSSENSKKQGLKRLNVVGKVSSRNKNGEIGSDGEDELRPTTSISKRFKLPRKFFDDCDAVDHASVPRKLRSAVKKRNHEPISPQSPDNKKPNKANGRELPRKDSIKKSKQRDSRESQSQVVGGSITKDEEEVVETLTALAVMVPFPNNSTTNYLHCEFGNTSSSPLPKRENSRPAFEDSAAPVKEEDAKSVSTSTTSEAANPSLFEGPAHETVLLKYPNEPSHPDFQLHTELDKTVYRENVQAISLLSNNEPIDGKPSFSSVGWNVQRQLFLENSSKLHVPRDEAAGCIAAGPVAVGSRHKLQRTLKECKNSGSALWPGLSAEKFDSAGAQGLSLEPSAAETPAWLAMVASATPPVAMGNGFLTEKESATPFPGKKSWKKCLGHVYISRLIKALQIADRNEWSHAQPTQLTPHEGSIEGMLLVANNINRNPSDLSLAASAHSIVCSTAEKSPNDVRNAILLHKRLLQDQQEASNAAALYTTEMKSFDLLSLSAGGGGLEAKNNTNKVWNGLETLTQFHVPYLQSLAQNQSVLPFPLPQNRFCSTPFPENFKAAATKQVQIQQPPFLGSQFLGLPHLGPSASPKQQPWIWTAQCQPGGVAESVNWENGRQEPSAMHYAQTILPAYSSDVLGPKYASISLMAKRQQQQQQLNAVTSSLAPARAKRKQYHIPYGFEGNDICSCPDSPLPLQLLCNEQL